MKVTQSLKKAAKRGLVVAVAVMMLLSFGFSTAASTFVPYSSYTYDFDGNAMESPHAYVAAECMTNVDMQMSAGDAMKNPSDMFIGPDGTIYIADTGNNRILFFSPELKYLGYLDKFYNEDAILPYVQEKLATEKEEAEKKFERRLKNLAEDEDDPQVYKFSFEQLNEIEKAMAIYGQSNGNAGYSVEEGEAAYKALIAGYTDVTMPPYDVMVGKFLEYVYPVTYCYDGLADEYVDSEPYDDPETRRCYTYYDYILKSTADDPSSDTFYEPEGVFVDENGILYVADTGKGRVVKFEHYFSEDEDPENCWGVGNFMYLDSFYKPDSSILDEALEFRPMNLVVDSAGRLYVNVKNVNSGIMQLSANGEFMGYYGAQKVSSSVFQWFTQLFQSDEQRARTVRIVPRVYNNIAIDYKNFVWVTANSMDTADLFGYLSSGSSSTAPIKRLNPSGNDVLVRNGIWAPGGDVVEKVNDVSSIIDVAIKGDTGIYTLADDVRNKLFTYDSEGNLLYAFGGSGTQLGLFKLIGAVAYQGTDMLVLDKSQGSISRFKQTEYATMIETALTADAEREYERSEEAWKQVQKLNSNLDLAYIGLAKCYLHRAAQADTAEAKELYQKAMEYYKLARNTQGYSKAYKEYRSLYVRDHLLLVLVVIIAICVLIYFAVRALNKQNAKLHITGTPTTLKEELCYSWRAIFHPINGFWEIKREKRGSMRAAWILLALAVVAFCFQSTGTAYLFNNVAAEEISLVQQAANVLLPVLLWVLASWAFTTLMSGEGSMKDIFIALCYGLVPMIILLIPVTIASNFCSLDEGPFLTFFTSLAYGWMGLLVVFGSMVVQDYTFSKNLLTVILSLLGMAAIMFIVLLLISLTGKMFGFLATLYQEVAYRL